MLLRVERLRTTVETPAGPRAAVDGVDFEIERGRTLALVGESGCGKSLTALSVVRLLPAGARIAGGRVVFQGRDLMGLSEAQMRGVRGARIGMIFQEPMSSLNPVMRVGAQVAEPLRAHLGLARRAAWAKAVELLERVALPDPARRAREHPHELSGGMRQRVMIAMAVACGPELLIADEPTTALDATTQLQILELLRELQRSTGLALLLITHDLGVVSRVADSACVLYAGRVVERGPAHALLTRPAHPYTQGLLRCTPRLRAPRARLEVIAGEPPGPAARPTGCAFHPRCELGRGEDDCRTREPPLEALPGAPRRACACWKVGAATWCA